MLLSMTLQPEGVDQENLISSGCSQTLVPHLSATMFMFWTIKSGQTSTWKVVTMFMIYWLPSENSKGIQQVCVYKAGSTT